MLTEREVEVGRTAIEEYRAQYEGETPVPVDVMLRVAWEAIDKERGLAIIGRERAIVDGLTAELRNHALRLASYSDVHETRRGSEFELLVRKGYTKGGAIVRVSVELVSVAEELYA